MQPGWYRISCEREDGQVAIRVELPRDKWSEPVYFKTLADCAARLSSAPGISMVLPTREDGQLCYLVKGDMWGLRAIGFDDKDAMDAVSVPSTVSRP